MKTVKAVKRFIGVKDEGGIVEKDREFSVSDNRCKTLKKQGFVKELKAPIKTKELKINKQTKKIRFKKKR